MVGKCSHRRSFPSASVMEQGGLFPPTKGFLNNWDLHTSSKAGDILRVKYLVEQLDVDVNDHDEHDSSPLFYACLCGHVGTSLAFLVSYCNLLPFIEHLHVPAQLFGQRQTFREISQCSVLTCRFCLMKNW